MPLQLVSFGQRCRMIRAYLEGQLGLEAKEDYFQEEDPDDSELEEECWDREDLGVWIEGVE